MRKRGELMGNETPNPRNPEPTPQSVEARVNRAPAKTALIVAIADYGDKATYLPAALTELTGWKNVLEKEPFNFHVECKQDKEATHDVVRALLVKRLQELQASDQFVFVFLGHGGLAAGRYGITEDALIMYPENSLEKAALTVGELTEIWNEAQPPKGADITMVLDCCFAARFKIDLETKEVRELTDASKRAATIEQFAAQFAGPTEAVRSASGRFQSFYDLKSWVPRKREIETPLLLAATRRRQSAFQIPSPDGRPRLLFSYKALEKLEELAQQGQRDTFSGFVASITPLIDGVRQTPKLVGQKQRKQELMFGEIGSGKEKKGISEGKSQRLDEVETSPFSINLRILGLCCIIPPLFSSPFERRIVMPYDDVTDPEKYKYPHFAFMEIPEEDIIRRSGLEPAKRYFRGGVYFVRWDLLQHRVEFNNDDGGDFEPTESYETYVPKMRALAPELDALPRLECYDEIPRRDLFSLFVDIDSGAASISTLEPVETIYMRPQTLEVTWGPRRTPTSVKIVLPTTGPETKILIYGPQGAPAAEIVVRSGASIMVGNAREKDITGDGSGSSPSEYFRMMYKLAPAERVNAPLPFVAAVPIDSCSVHNWP
jgi:hypothetical protein